MSNKVKLRRMTHNNWEAVIHLEINAGQEDPMANNLYSVAEAQVGSDVRLHPVYVEKRLVGFAMYNVQKTKGKAWIFSIYRFMIDQKLYMPENPVVKPFYTSLGFVEAGRDRDGEVIEALKP
jgi:hypothetical protein